MTDETKNLFNAPWEWVEEPDCLWIQDANGKTVFAEWEVYGEEKHKPIRENMNRVCYMPELYDALMGYVVNDRPHAFISNDECRLCPDKKCKTREAVELLRKVREGK